MKQPLNRLAWVDSHVPSLYHKSIMGGLFSDIPEIVEDLKAGHTIVLVDDEQRENEGDLVCAAEKVTPEVINFMAAHGRGLVCLPMAPELIGRLNLPPQTADNTARFGTAFTVSIDARSGVTTGISAADRARTVQVAVADDTQPQDLARPGHVFPIRAREGGVLVRAGQTEGAVDLARAAGLKPAGVICEIMKADGTMARLPDLKRFAGRHHLNIISVNQLIAYRIQRERLVRRMAETTIPTRWGDVRLIAYGSIIDPDEHAALVMGDVSTPEPVLVRVHSQCVTGDVFHSLRCDCGEQVELALERIAEEGRGVFVYMRQEGRGIGFCNKIRAYALQDGQGLDTVEANEALGFPADRRDYGIGMQILVDLGLKQIRLLTNNPSKRVGLEGYGLEVVERIPIIAQPNPHNMRYLETKRDKLGHLLDIVS